MSSAPSAVRLELDCRGTISYAMQQNDVPVVRQLRVTNTAVTPLENVHIRLSSEPALFPGQYPARRHLRAGRAKESFPPESLHHGRVPVRGGGFAVSKSASFERHSAAFSAYLWPGSTASQAS